MTAKSTHEKKKKRTLILMLALLLVMGGLYATVRMISSRDAGEETKEEKPKAVDIPQNSIVELAYGYDDYAWNFYKQDNRWFYKDDPTFPLSQVYIPSMASGVSSLTYEKIIEEDVEDLSQYGLDDPKYFCTVKQDDGNVITIYIGDENPVTGKSYLTVEGSNTVYTVDISFPGRFSYNLYEMAVFDDLPPLAEKDVTQIDIRTEQYEYSVYHFTSGTESVDYTGKHEWFIKDESGNYIPVEKEITEFWFRYLADKDLYYYNKCVGYTDDPQILDAYGLKDPQFTVSFHYTAMEEVDTGKVDANGMPVLTQESRNAVITFNVGDGNPFDGSQRDTEDEETDTEDETDAENLKMDMVGVDLPTIGEGETLPISESENEPEADPEEVVEEAAEEGLELYIGFYYVQPEGSMKIYRMESALFNQLVRYSDIEVTNEHVNDIDVADINSIEISTRDGQARVDIARSSAGENESNIVRSYSLNGNEMSEDDFNAFYDAVTAIYAIKGISEEDAIPENPEFKVTYTLNNKFFETVEVSYTKYDLNYYQLNLNGKPVKLVNKKDVVKAQNLLTGFTQ